MKNTYQITCVNQFCTIKNYLLKICSTQPWQIWYPLTTKEGWGRFIVYLDTPLIYTVHPFKVSVIAVCFAVVNIIGGARTGEEEMLAS